MTKVINNDERDWEVYYDAMPYSVPAKGSAIFEDDIAEHFTLRLPKASLDLQPVKAVYAEVDGQPMPFRHTDGTRFATVEDLVAYSEHKAEEKVRAQFSAVAGTSEQIIPAKTKRERLAEMAGV